MLYALLVRLDRHVTFRRHWRATLLPLALLLLQGCSSERPLNPTFSLTRSEARAALEQMREEPKSLARPVLVLGGIHDPGLIASNIADVIRDRVHDRQCIIDVSFFETATFDKCARKVIQTLEKHYPSDEPLNTIEVDVVAFSMGGLVARHAASNDFGARNGRRLRIARLFTISAPHQGADIAQLPTFDDRIKDMRPGAPFLSELDAPGNGDAEYPLFAYVRLHDGVIGEEHAAPPGMAAWWVPCGFTLSHTLAGNDLRILADILRRLRYEEPYSIEPPAPLPEDE